MPSRQVTIQGIITWEGPEGPVDPGWGGGRPPRPDQGLPPFQGYPGHGLPQPPVDPGWGNRPPTDPGYGQGGGFRPDNSLPGGGYPSHGLPGGGYPSQGLPWGPGRPDNSLPWQPGHPGNIIPGLERPDQGLPSPSLTPSPTPPESEEYNWFKAANGWVVGQPKEAEPKE